MMKRKIILIVFLLFLSACHKAGTEGGKCLEGEICQEKNLTCNYEGKCIHCGESAELCCEEDPCNEGLVCNESGYCQSCGRYGTPCCEGSKCDENYNCGNGNNCVHCGWEGEPCCSNALCNFSLICGADNICVECGQIGQSCCEKGENTICLIGACTPGGICRNQICDKENRCVECGIKNQPCCEGSSCSSGYVCNENNICENCGYRGFPVCVDGTCDGWWQVIDGFCKNPFEVDPETSADICTKANEGHNRSERDWCYWYAAFQKLSPSLCEKINWEDMRNKCQEMENPDDYQIMYW